MLLGLARGSGTRSLAGMAARAGVYRRPLLDLPREVVVAAALEAAAADPRLEPWTDPHNTDAGFARVRVRHEVLPVLEAALGPGIVEALARTATQAREDADALDAWAERVWALAVERADAGREPAAEPPPRPAPAGLVRLIVEGCCRKRSKNLPRSPAAAGAASVRQPGPTALPIAALTTAGEPLPPAIVHRVVRRFLIEAGCPVGSLTAGHIRAVAALLEPGSVRARRSRPARRPTCPQGSRRPGCESLTPVDAADIGTDLEKVLLDEATLQARLREMAAQVDADYEGRDVLLVGVLKGAVMVMADLARAMSIHLQMDWMAVSSYGSSTKSSGVVRILKDLDTDITGRHVLIVEDIIDSGLTLSWLMRNLTARGAASVEVLTMLRKPEAVKVELEPRYIGFDIPNEFVVGYGLDYAEKYRNLREIGTLAPHVYS